MRRVLACLPVACAFLVTGCGGGGGSSPGGSASSIPLASSPGPAVGNTSIPSSSLFSITYLPLDPGGRIDEPAHLAQRGNIAVDEICSGNLSQQGYVYDHGAITHLDPSIYLGGGPINSNNELLLDKTPGDKFVFHNLLTGVDVPLQGDVYAAAGINDSGYAGGAVCTVPGTNGNPCQKFPAARFAPDGSFQLLSTNSVNPTGINGPGTVLGWENPNSAGDIQTMMFEKTRTESINTVVGEPSVSPIALNDNNEVL